MTTTLNNYQQQAIDFLTATNTQFSATFLKTGKHFNDDTDERDIYEIELKRGSRVYKFKFGQSVNNSGEYLISIYIRNQLGGLKRKFASKKELKKFSPFGLVVNDIVKNHNYSAPTPYDVLACLTKYDPGTFEDFCNEFGCDTDSKKAEKNYLSVKDEYMNVCALFTDAEIEQLQEIQ